MVTLKVGYFSTYPVIILSLFPPLSSLVNYLLRVARLNKDKEATVRWPENIKTEFSRRFDRTVEPEKKLVNSNQHKLSKLPMKSNVREVDTETLVKIADGLAANEPVL